METRPAIPVWASHIVQAMTAPASGFSPMATLERPLPSTTSILLAVCALCATARAAHPSGVPLRDTTSTLAPGSNSPVVACPRDTSGTASATPLFDPRDTSQAPSASHPHYLVRLDRPDPSIANLPAGGSASEWNQGNTNRLQALGKDPNRNRNDWTLNLGK